MRKLVIVGGGSSGWMAAAMLSKTLGARVQISLIESAAIGTVGVGEASIPPLTLFNQALGLDERAFMAATHASIKLGIVFDGWGQRGEQYMHAFGELGRPLGLMGFQHVWLRQQEPCSRFWDFSVNALAAKNNRYGSQVPNQTSTNGLSHAYHFDANRYAKVLKQFSLRHGVNAISAMVTSWQLCPDSGDIVSLDLDNGDTVTADFFIDCSGFQSLLLGKAMGVDFIDWSEYLPCDSAWAVPCERGASIPPYTRSIAHEGGWQWQIPLQHRTGNGMVYSSRFWRDEQALQCLLAHLPGKPLAEPKLLKFTTGRRQEQWRGNCLALGLASGFLEPLESTSIHLVQSGILRFIKLFPQGRAPELRAEYNRQSALEFAQIRDFLILHYHLNRRDEPLWRYCQTMAIPTELQRRIALFGAQGYVGRQQDELFAEPAWLQVMLGQGLRPQHWHPMADEIDATDLKQYLQDLRSITASSVSGLATHDQFLQDYCPSQGLS
ncbi:tryptophan halogenase family protein [Shewanella sp. NIFS-20-20]|uniref:tryptophan halogenase family protein n=1 Tax=Shewanella sp. NIFS-20-20 TaxID=2853806 RepID=UPI001C45BDBF|nr:tryptophan halogenase family protein [Shewanella sp. NIFS-20-20]MBV7315276.1 tryptophan 7-halogenase [Shewanella sp. NIFS-20-20]